MRNIRGAGQTSVMLIRPALLLLPMKIPADADMDLLCCSVGIYKIRNSL